MTKRVPKSSASAPAPKKHPWNDTRALSPEQKRAAKTPPASALTPLAIDELPFRWSADSIDHEYQGEWDWSLQPKETKDVLDLLAGLHDLNWREVKEQKFHSKHSTRQLHHKQPVTSICREAQKRLVELGRGDQEEVFRLRHGNTARLWGVLEDGVLRILWYDRGHKICPSES